MVNPKMEELHIPLTGPIRSAHRRFTCIPAACVLLTPIQKVANSKTCCRSNNKKHMLTIVIKEILIHITDFLYEAGNKELLAHLVVVSQNLIQSIQLQPLT